MKVPFADLKAQYRRIQTEIDAAVADCIQNTAFVGGPKIKAFEQAFADFVGVQHGIGCANGTDSIEIGMEALGLMEKGGEVLVPAHSWISSAESVTRAGGKVVFVDTLPETYVMDPADAARKVTDQTVGIMPVHLYGMPAPMVELRALAEKHGLWILEDCAQAHGAELHGERVGTMGDLASFSFYPGKNLGAYGDAGGMFTNREDLALTCRKIANHGQLTKHQHELEGRNSRMDTLQAAVLSAKLPHLETWTEERIAAAQRYNDLLKDLPAQLPVLSDDYRHVFHLYVIQVDNRDAVRAALSEAGIATGIHYPTALPLLPCYDYLGHTAEDFPVASKAMDHILSLPMYPELTEEMQVYVAEQLKKALSAG